MSRLNKVNKGNYTQRGRLTPDDMARERMQQRQVTGHAQSEEKATRPARQPGAREPSRPRSAPEE